MQVLKRISGENIDLMSKNDLVTYKLNKEEEILHVFVKSKKKNNYEFYIDNKYPFKCPFKIIVNNKDYYMHALYLIPKFKKLLKKLDNKECLCCSSITCQDKWSPAKRLWQLVDEGDEMIAIKQKIFYLYYTRLIAENFLTHDIPLERYL